MKDESTVRFQLKIASRLKFSHVTYNPAANETNETLEQSLSRSFIMVGEWTVDDLEMVDLPAVGKYTK